MIYTIELTEDGDVYVKGMLEDHFEIAINKSPDSFEFDGIDPIDPAQLRDNTMITSIMNWNDSSGRILAIRGEIVKVAAVTKVETWEVK